MRLLYAGFLHRMFYGSHVHVLDDKGRVSLPKDFRGALEKTKGSAWITAYRHCAVILTSDGFDEWRQQLVNRSDPRVERISRIILGMASPCSADRQGRFQIPPALRAHAGIARDIVFVGVGNEIEVWDRGRYEVSLAESGESFDSDRIEVLAGTDD